MTVPVPSISCCVLNRHNLFYQIHNALAFNRDMYCHIALCLRLPPFHFNRIFFSPPHLNKIADSYKFAWAREQTQDLFVLSFNFSHFSTEPHCLKNMENICSISLFSKLPPNKRFFLTYNSLMKSIWQT
jgi:hypothetical protein